MRKQRFSMGSFRKGMALVLALAMLGTVLTGCGNREEEAGQTQEESKTEEQRQEENRTEEQTAVEIRVGSLKGPTSIGLMKLMKDAQEGMAANQYTFTMETAADALLPMMLQGELDIALVPANVAGVLYQKTEGAVSVIDINTLGVLYLVCADTSLSEISDLKGRTIYLTGKGTTPDYVLHYILEQNGLAEGEVTLEYKSEAAEVAAILANEPESIGLLPQPFVTAACVQNESLQVIFDMTKEWRSVQGESGSELVTGVTIVRNEFLQENTAAVHKFLEEHKASAEYANNNVEETAELVAEQGIIEKAAIAQKAIPECNITYIDGEQMQAALSGYLQVLYEQAPESVGGSLPAAEFYYIR